MRIVPTGNTGEWEIEGIGRITRTAQGKYSVSVSQATDITQEEWFQVAKFIEDAENSN